MADLGQTFLPNIKYLRPDVVMLCANDGWDVRALKEARSLAAAGLSVVIVGRRRYHTELARFSDEFDIDIVDVPMLNDPTTMQLHLESGVWHRMSLAEKLIATFMLWWFKLTNLKIHPNFVPPPVSKEITAKLESRKQLLSRRAKLRVTPKKIRVKNKRLWRETLARYYGRKISLIGRLARKNAVIFQFTRLLALLLKGVIFILALPFVILIFPFWFFYKSFRWIYTKIKRFIPEPPNVLGRIHHRILNEIRKSGRNLFRYGRFFLYTIEYGETVARLNPKIIHAHDLYTLQAATRIAKWTGSKVIYDAHELESDRRADTPKKMRDWIIEQEKKYAPRANGVITVSHAIGDELVQECKVNVQPTVVFNSPVIKAMPAKMRGRSLRGDLRLKRTVPLFVFVGKVYEIYKGNQKVSFIIEAIAACEDFHLAIVGPMSENARSQIAVLTQTLGCTDRIHIVRPIPAESIVHYIKSADVSVYFMWPDTRNIDLTIPNKLFEFSLSGLPLVVSSLHSTRWFCEQFDNAIPVTENSAQAIAQACREAYDKRENLSPDGEALSIMKRDYSWEAQAKKLWALYQSLLASDMRKIK